MTVYLYLSLSLSLWFVVSVSSFRLVDLGLLSLVSYLSYSLAHSVIRSFVRSSVRRSSRSPRSPVFRFVRSLVRSFVLWLGVLNWAWFFFWFSSGSILVSLLVDLGLAFVDFGWLMADGGMGPHVLQIHRFSIIISSFYDFWGRKEKESPDSFIQFF